MKILCKYIPLELFFVENEYINLNVNDYKHYTGKSSRILKLYEDFDWLTVK